MAVSTDLIITFALRPKSLIRKAKHTHATMKKVLFTLLLAGVVASPAMARKKKKTEQQAPVKTEKPAGETRSGLFTVTKTDADWFLTIPDSLLGREILATVRFTSTPANTGKYGGELTNQQTVYFQKVDKDKLLMRSRLLVNAADSTDAINRAILISNADPIIGSFKIEGKDSAAYKVKVTAFFNEDNPALGLPSYMKTSMGLQGLIASSSYIEGIHTFPMNTEVRTVKTWNAGSASKTIASGRTGKVTLGLNISFVLLPKEPMQRRLFDPRVGYFTDQFTQFSDQQQRVESKRFITRWRLEPKNAEDAEKMKRGELVEPKKPIVYYIDPATPKQWRPYLIQGVNDWQKAFEKAGFKNAIYAKEWPENDSTMSMEDARYSCIRYLASPIENAYGPNVHDPRSGEILESHICWYHNVMSLVHDWYLIQAGNLDEAAQKMNYDTDLMGQLIRFVSSHEVGHTLGLRHNFGSSSTVPVDSLRSRNYVIANGHTPSIMDYARFNYVAQPEDNIPREGIFPRIGVYDQWAIEWGYKPMFQADDMADYHALDALTTQRLKVDRHLWFGDGETNRTNDARCQTEDLGDDAMKASEYGILNIKRQLPQLVKWTYDEKDIYAQHLGKMYRQELNQLNRYVFHVMRNLGGVYCDFKTINEEGSVYSDEPRNKQVAAFEFLKKHVLTEPAWLIEQPYMNRIYTDAHEMLNSWGANMAANMVSASLLSRLTSTYPASDYLPAVVNALFGSAGARPSAYTQAQQCKVVDSLLDTFNRRDKNYSVVLQQLQNIQRQCKRLAAQPHYAALADIIERSLTIK